MINVQTFNASGDIVASESFHREARTHRIQDGLRDRSW